MPNARKSLKFLTRSFCRSGRRCWKWPRRLDRLDRASGSLASESRRAQVQAAIQVLLRPEDDRAEQIQLIFSRPYEDDWREKFGV